MPRTLLAVGRGPGLLRVLARAGALRLRTAAAVPPGEPAAAGRVATVDLDAGEPVEAAARAAGADGVLAVSPDAVVAAAETAAALGLPGAGPRAAPLLRSRIALRRRLADAGVPQPRFAAARSVHEGRAALATVGVPAMLLPAEPWIANGRFALANVDDLEARLHRTLAASPAAEAIVEGAPAGERVEVLVACTRRDAVVLTVADRPDAATVCYPSVLFGDALAAADRVALHTAHALELQDGVLAVLLASSGAAAEVVDVRLWTPDEPLDALLRHAVGIDLLEVALRAALAADLPRGPRFHRPAALRLSATDGVRTAEQSGVVERGEGYVVATAETNIAARKRVEAVT